MSEREPSARRLWVCTSCDGVCRQSGNREIDGWDLICGGCGQVYVISGSDLALLAGS